jgi:hypothetical protein
MPYLDSGGSGRVMLALHGTLGRGAIFTRLAADLRGRRRRPGAVSVGAAASAVSIPGGLPSWALPQ